MEAKEHAVQLRKKGKCVLHVTCSNIACGSVINMPATEVQ